MDSYGVLPSILLHSVFYVQSFYVRTYSTFIHSTFTLLHSVIHVQSFYVTSHHLSLLGPATGLIETQEPRLTGFLQVRRLPADLLSRVRVPVEGHRNFRSGSSHPGPPGRNGSSGIAGLPALA